MNYNIGLRWIAMMLLMSLSNLASGSEQGLGRTWAKLERDKKLTIGYLGGSITCGTGASDAERTSWRALTTEWFRKQFPDAKISEINAGIGGTGADLGAYRCQKDLLSRHPDLVFVEFAVNDFWLSRSQEIASMEGIVRQVWKANPQADIVFFYTASKQTGTGFYDKGQLPKAVVSQQEVADRYGIITVNGGAALWRAIADGNGTWETLTKDTTHPLDSGYSIYADALRKMLEGHLNDKAAAAPELGAPLSPDPLENARMVDAYTVPADGWSLEPALPGMPFCHGLAANKPGTEMNYPFTGSGIGVYWVIAPDSGNIEYSIDDGPVKIRSSWDSFALRFTRGNYTILQEGLDRKNHVLHLRIASTKEEKSTGTWIKVGAFLVH